MSLPTTQEKDEARNKQISDKFEEMEKERKRRLNKMIDILTVPLDKF
jgi:hypothetical protein